MGRVAKGMFFFFLPALVLIAFIVLGRQWWQFNYVVLILGGAIIVGILFGFFYGIYKAIIESNWVINLRKKKEK